jgi:hypothetical protein
VLANIFLSSCCSCEGWSGSESVSARLIRFTVQAREVGPFFFLLEIIKLIGSFSIYLVRILSFFFSSSFRVFVESRLVEQNIVG